LPILRCSVLYCFTVLYCIIYCNIVLCYLGPDGEHHWSKHYPFCGGTFQSPIDIQTQLMRFDPTLRPIELQNYNPLIQLSLPRRMYVSSLTHRYTAAQLHFHWGSEHLPVGSEHTINGRTMHMVLFNSDKYPNISVAADKSDGLAVLGVLIEVGEFNPAFNQFLKYINGIKYRDQRVQVPAFNIRNLLPVLLDEYYRYDGSLTTPPCYPSVLWTVFKNPVTISLKQFLALATAIYSSHQQESAPVAMNSNYRKPQFTDNRVVLCSFQGGRGLQGATQTVTSPFLRRQVINQLLDGDLADLADQDGLNQLLDGDLDGLNQLLDGDLADLADQDELNKLLPKKPRSNKVPSVGVGADMLCYISLEQNVSRRLSRGRSPPHTDTQLVQALRETLFPELNLRSYLGCKSDLAPLTIRQLLRGRSATDEALELDQAIVKALGGRTGQTIVGQRGSTKKQQTNTFSMHRTGFASAPAAVPRKPNQPIPWLQPMEWED
uniref:carbonic anhydrase n=1 Tax=Salmo trutta TaxID=8032 RepID=A0A673YR18_SALTR